MEGGREVEDVCVVLEGHAGDVPSCRGRRSGDGMGTMGTDHCCVGDRGMDVVWVGRASSRRRGRERHGAEDVRERDAVGGKRGGHAGQASSISRGEAGMCEQEHRESHSCDSDARYGADAA